MYTKSNYKHIRGIVPLIVASVGTTAAYNSSSLNTTTLCGLSTKMLGTNFECTIKCTTGNIYVRPGSTIEPTATNSIILEEGEILDVRVKTFMSIKGDTTTAAFQAIVWGDD